MAATPKERRVINHLLSNFDSFFHACCNHDDDKELAYVIHKVIRSSKPSNNVIILQSRGELLFKSNEIHQVVTRILKKFDDEYKADSVWLDLSTLISLNGGSKIYFRSGVDSLRGETFEAIYSQIPVDEVMAAHPWLYKSAMKNVLLNNQRWMI